MRVLTSEVTLQTRGFNDIHDITDRVAKAVTKSGLAGGVAVVFVPGSTAGLTSIEYEPGAVADLSEAISRVAPTDIPYAHDAAWGDGNGFSHVRAALIGASYTVPFADGTLLLGTWQQIVLVDFDNRPRSRRVIIQLMGD
ncbi:MAG: secondary thiamine-phosphate synthase enzyme YjbQ [bacterium]|nr:secondary thiamine-phosphate synthase enzyme YjbQ [bacterium]